MPGQLCNLWSKFAILTPVFWLIFEEFKNYFYAHRINLDLHFHLKSILVVKMHPMCLKLTPDTPHLTFFFDFSMLYLVTLTYVMLVLLCGGWPGVWPWGGGREVAQGMA